MRYLSQEQRSIFLLVFILLFIILTPFLEGDPGGELILVLNMYLTLVAATMELKEKRALFLRILAALEAAAGVLYIAITVARLVASYQTISREESSGMICGFSLGQARLIRRKLRQPQA